MNRFWVGHGFSRAVRELGRMRALAPEGRAFRAQRLFLKPALGVLLLAASTMLAQNAVPEFAVSPAANSTPPITVPTWRGSFLARESARGALHYYSYTMIGTNPNSSPVTTYVPVVLVPIQLTFLHGAPLDATSKTISTVASPIFQAAEFPSGFTQFGDAVQRAEFWSALRTPASGYHVLLEQPKLLPTQTIEVPVDFGVQFNAGKAGIPVGMLDLVWFQEQLQTLLYKLHPDPRALTIFLTYNALVFHDKPENCCLIGAHSVLRSTDTTGRTIANTFIWATYNDAGLFDAPIQDVTALSHEVGEWLNDPLVNNVVPAWSLRESEPCSSSLLEVGDPIASADFPSFPVHLNGLDYHLQDVAFLSWFARHNPSPSLMGRYSLAGKLTRPAAECRATQRQVSAFGDATLR